MKLVTHFFGSSSSSSKKESKRTKVGKNGGGANNKSSSFGSTSTASSCSSPVATTTPRTVLPSASSPSETNKPAALTREELEAALRTVAASDAELAEMLADETGGGAVVALMEETIAVAADEGELREAFAVFDADGDGRISAEELRLALASLGDDRCSVDDCRRMIRGVDADGDGFVCFREFTTMMTTN